MAAKKEKDSNFTFTPARTYEDLKTLYGNHVAEVIDAEEVPTENIKQEKEVDMAETKPVEEIKESTSSQFIDPFNQSEPIVRDYVFGDQSLEKGNSDKKQTFTPGSFDEPQSFDEAFVIPDDEDDTDAKPSSSKNESSSKSEEKKPINPRFDDMKGSLQKKKTKKFAKYIVEAVSVLQQKGFVWYANKDINDAKLNEYELNGEMDLSLLVTLADGQEVTVKEFFQSQCMKAEQMSHISAEQKEDLTDSLTEVLMEQGAGPTPTQELMLVALTIIGGQALTLMTLKAETGSLLSQLRNMNGDGGQQSSDYEEPWHQKENATVPDEPSEVNEPEITPNEKVESTPNEDVPVPESMQIGESIDTKE